MKGYAKIRLAVFLCIMLVIPSIVSVLPMTAQEVSAADNLYIGWCYEISSLNKTAVQIEKGANFYVGDYAHILDGDNSACASLFKNVTYSSSKKSVATVNSKGLLTAKKTGTTTIKIKYKGKTISHKFKVVKKGSYSKKAAAKKLQKDVNKLTSYVPSKITKSNALKYLKKYNTYNTATQSYYSDITANGFLRKANTKEIEAGHYITTYDATCKLAVPKAGRSTYLNSMLYEFGYKNSPTSTRGSKMMKLVSVHGSTKQITIKLKKPITVEQILSVNITAAYKNKKPNLKSAVIPFTLYDVTANTYVQAQGTIIKGSNFLKIKPVVDEYVNGNFVTKTTTFKKGHTYQIGEKVLRWGNGKTVKVK